MTLERLIAEILVRGEREPWEETQKFEAEKARSQEDRAHRVTASRRISGPGPTCRGPPRADPTGRGCPHAVAEAQDEAQERAMNAPLEAVRGLLRDFTTS